MESINTENQTKYTLELILSEADKHFSEMLSSVEKNTNRSYYLFGLYVSVVAYSFNEITKLNNEYLILIFGSVISCVILFKNLFPISKEIKGAKPEDLIQDYFNDFKDDYLEKEYLASLIESYNDSILINETLIKEMTERYKYSVYNIAITFFLFFLFFFIKCH